LQISVRFFTALREIAGKREETILLPQAEKITINTVLAKLKKEYGKPFVDYVYDNKTGEVHGFLQFLVNGRSISPQKGLETELSDRDVLAILPPVSGG